YLTAIGKFRVDVSEGGCSSTIARGAPDSLEAIELLTGKAFRRLAAGRRPPSLDILGRRSPINIVGRFIVAERTRDLGVATKAVIYIARHLVIDIRLGQRCRADGVPGRLCREARVGAGSEIFRLSRLRHEERSRR